MNKILLTRRMMLASTALVAVPQSLLAATASPSGAACYIISPHNWARVRSPVTVVFGLKGMGVTQAGSDFKDAGHHHLLIDVTEPLDPESEIPADKSHVHFGRGQTEATIELARGWHTLQLVLGDANHRPFNPSVQSDKIKIKVI